MERNASNKTGPEILLTIPEVAQMLHIGRSTVYDLLHDGLPFLKLGRATRISSQSLYRWIEQRERTATVQAGMTSHQGSLHDQHRAGKDQTVPRKIQDE